MLPELTILAALHPHPHIADFRGVWAPPPSSAVGVSDRAYLLLEFCDGDVWKILQHRRFGASREGGASLQVCVCVKYVCGGPAYLPACLPACSVGCARISVLVVLHCAGEVHGEHVCARTYCVVCVGAWRTRQVLAAWRASRAFARNCQSNLGHPRTAPDESFCGGRCRHHAVVVARRLALVATRPAPCAWVAWS